jgi:hypothetical protein
LQAVVVVKPAPGLPDQIALDDLNRHDLAQMRLQLAAPMLAQHTQSQNQACNLLMIVKRPAAAVQRPDRRQLRRRLAELPGHTRQNRRRNHLHRIERHTRHTHITDLDSHCEAVGVTPMPLDRRQISFPQRKKHRNLRRVQPDREMLPPQIALLPIAHESPPVARTGYPAPGNLQITGYPTRSVG